MKKRLWMLILSLSLACSTAGCAKTYSPDKEAEDSIRDDNSQNKDTDDKLNQTDMDESDSDNEAAVVPLGIFSDPDSIYLVYSDKSIKKVTAGLEYSYAKLVDDLIYVETREEETGEAVLTAMDTDGNKADTLLRGYASYDISVDKYKDKIYVTYSTYDIDEGQTYYSAFEYNPADKSLKEDSLMSDAMQYVADNSYCYIGFTNLVSTLEKYGEAILQSDSKIFVLNLEDYSIHNEQSFLDGDELGYVDAVCGDYALYHSEADYFSPQNYDTLDIKTGEKEHVIDINSEGTLQVLGTDDDCIYYSTRKANDESVAYVYSYNVKEKANTLLYTAVTPPGTGEFDISAGVSGAAYIGGRLYVEDIADAKAVWAYYDVDADKYEYTDNVIHEYSYAKYGIVSAAEGKQFYDGTDEINYRYKLEDFTLNDSVSNYKIINEHLRKVYDGYFEQAMENEDSMKDEVYDGEGWNYYMSLDRTLGSVQMIGSHYIQIIFNLYDYGGGAHGFGWSDYLMFDLDSGNQVSLSMLTDMDETSYKKLVAEKSMLVWEKDEYAFFVEYADSSQEERDKMYQDFYDGADMDNNYIGFYEDGIILYYAPYEYGPYASGFMEVPISYEELGIDINN